MTNTFLQHWKWPESPHIYFAKHLISTHRRLQRSVTIYPANRYPCCQFELAVQTPPQDNWYPLPVKGGGLRGNPDRSCSQNVTWRSNMPPYTTIHVVQSGDFHSNQSVVPAWKQRRTCYVRVIILTIISIYIFPPPLSWQTNFTNLHDLNGGHIPRKLKFKIWVGQFIDLPLLLKSASDLNNFESQEDL